MLCQADKIHCKRLQGATGCHANTTLIPYERRGCSLVSKKKLGSAAGDNYYAHFNTGNMFQLDQNAVRISHEGTFYVGLIVIVDSRSTTDICVVLNKSKNLFCVPKKVSSLPQKTPLSVFIFINQ